MGIHEHYKILGLAPDASLEDAKHAYRKLVNRWHPDRFARDDALLHLAEEHLKLFNIAYAEVKKHLATRPKRSRPMHNAPLRTGPANRVTPGFRLRRPPGTAAEPAVLNRLTRKFRQMLAAWVSAPQQSGRIWKRPVTPPGSGPTEPGVKAPDGPAAKPGKDFDEIFNEVAGPDAARIKKAAALRKRERPQQNERRRAASGPIQPASRKTGSRAAPVVTPVSRIKRVGRVRRI